MPTRIGPIQEDEIKTVLFDFTDEGVNGTLSSPVVEVILSTGSDPSPSTVIVGAASADGLTVTQAVRYQVPRASYILRCVATDGAGMVHVVTALLEAKAVV